MCKAIFISAKGNVPYIYHPKGKKAAYREVIGKEAV